METSAGHVWTFSRLPLSCPFVLEIAVPSSMMSYLLIFNRYHNAPQAEGPLVYWVCKHQQGSFGDTLSISYLVILYLFLLLYLSMYCIHCCIYSQSPTFASPSVTVLCCWSTLTYFGFGLLNYP
jgi:hypothetical protein